MAKAKKSKFPRRSRLILFVGIAVVVVAALSVFMMHRVNQGPERQAIVKGLACDRLTMQFLATDVFCNEGFYSNPKVTRELAYKYLQCEYNLDSEREKEIQTMLYEAGVDEARERQTDLALLYARQATCKSDKLLDAKRAKIAQELNQKLDKDVVRY